MNTEYPMGPGLDFLRRLWRLDHALARLSARMERRLGITAPQRLVLRCVGKFPGLSAGQLANLLHLDPSTISSALRRLEQRGLLERRRHPHDRRRVVLGLTAAGRGFDRPRAGTVEHAVESLIAELPAADRTTVETTVDRLTALVEAEDNEPAPAEGAGAAPAPARRVRRSRTPAPRRPRTRR